MSSSRRFGRIAATAVAAVVITGMAAPAALASAPAPAPAAASVAPMPGDTPIKGGLLNLDLAANLDLDAHGIVVAGVKGAVQADAGINLKVGAGSKLIHRHHKLVGGTVVFKGGVQLSKGGKKVVLSNIVLDVKTNVLWASVGAKAKVRIGVLSGDGAQVVSGGGSVNADIVINGGLVLDASAGALIDASLGTCVFADADVVIGVGVDANVDLDVDLAIALGLNADIDLDLGIGALLDADVDAHISLL
ncbi:hypothetical protein [Streptomyces sp. NBC_01465]|uniref:hypothetical protein n=1 Tax=Streptomyces sp. NBC_01465 TaxID=2903878 RepID=UPI002E364EA0|nr:hypothetical protein [Streptomyces sp. NBC_01465]